MIYVGTLPKYPMLCIEMIPKINEISMPIRPDQTFDSLFNRGLGSFVTHT